MTQTPKQWAATGFMIGIASGIAAAVMFLFFIYNSKSASAATPRMQVAAAAPMQTESKPSATTISGTIELDPSVAGKVPSPATVFVIARDETKKGHPVLAKRLDVSAFPASFILGPEDAMMAQALPPRVLLEARIDRDGDAATREPNSPSDSVSGVAMGSSNVVLRLH